ncbi:arginase [Sinorhizobium sp. PC2]|uniref:arginase n=1 Tax=Ensifer aridi TaxID=1708715 RepID=UPI000614CD47
MLCKIVGIPLQVGASQLGCEMGPSAIRVAGLVDALRELDHEVVDMGNVASPDPGEKRHPNCAVRALHEVSGWIRSAAAAAFDASESGMPNFLGGDHAIAAGTVSGMAKRAAVQGRPFFVLWLDAHTDFHTLETTASGNLHGTPVAYHTGQPGFEGYYPDLEVPVDPANLCMMGIRSVDPAERAAISRTAATVHDMRAIDEHGFVSLLRSFLGRVEREKGLLHVSFDVDFLDAAIGPAVGTNVPGGATFREAHLVMEMLHESGLVSSLDLVELNPFLDERGRTAQLLVDLTASLMGRTVLDRPTRSY